MEARQIFKGIAHQRKPGQEAPEESRKGGFEAVDGGWLLWWRVTGSDKPTWEGQGGEKNFKFQTQILTLLASCSKPVLPNWGIMEFWHFYQALRRPFKNWWGLLCLWNSMVVPKLILKQSWPPVGFSSSLKPGISYLDTCWLSMHSYGHIVGSTWEANQACKGLYPHCKMVTMIGPALSQV